MQNFVENVSVVFFNHIARMGSENARAADSAKGGAKLYQQILVSGAIIACQFVQVSQVTLVNQAIADFP